MFRWPLVWADTHQAALNENAKLRAELTEARRQARKHQPEHLGTFRAYSKPTVTKEEYEALIWQYAPPGNIIRF